MHPTRFLSGVAATAVLLGGVVEAATTTFTNTRRFLFDVDGDQIDAYGSKINYFDGAYYLYGNSFEITGVAFGIKSYSSVDLVNWVYQGFLYDPYVDNPCNGIGGCGRPHILYQPTSKKYILWANAGSNGYIIATSSSPSGGFVFESSTAMIDPAFASLQPADFSVETFDNKGYLVFSALNFRDSRKGSLWPAIYQTLHLSPLTSDFMNTTGVSYNVTSPKFDLVDQQAESPDIFMRNGLFYVAASNTCGYCNGSIALIYRASSINGPWTRDIIAGDSCNGQVEGVLPLTQNGVTTYVWHSTSVPGGPRVGFGGHIFQPLVFNNDGSVQDLNCAASAQFTVSFPAGKGAAGSGLATIAADSSPLLANYYPVCDQDQFMMHQTWTSTKTGTLKQVAVNVAKASQVNDLTINVFRYTTIAELTSAEYKYELLGTATFTPSNLTYVFNTASVFPNAVVKAGDQLGFSLIGSDFSPYCHMEYDLSSVPSYGGAQKPLLLQQGIGQYSYRGANGRKSPVYVRPGKGIKFFAVVE